MNAIGRPIQLFFAFLLAIALAGCSSEDESTSTTQAATAVQPGPSVSIDNFAYEPANLQVKVGDTVTVTNNDSVSHTLTANDKSFDTGPLSPGQTATIKVTKAGTNPYFCGPHPYMTGVIEATA